MPKLVWLVGSLLVATVGCGSKKEPAPGPPMPLLELRAIAAPLPAAPVEASKAFVGAPFLELIPADSDLVVVGTTAGLPPGVAARLRGALEPVMRASAERWAALAQGTPLPGASPQQQIAESAIAAELGGRLDAAGLERVGLSATPRFALYMIGRSLVLRLEVLDTARLLSAVQRVTAALGTDLAPGTLDGVSYIAIPIGDEHVITIGLLGTWIAVGFSTADAAEALRPVLFGLTPPPESLAQRNTLAEVGQQYDLGNTLLGYASVPGLLSLAPLLLPYLATPGCEQELDRLLGGGRIAGGYRLVAHQRTERIVVVEVPPAGAAWLRSLLRPVPWWGGVAQRHPTFAMAAGLDLGAAKEWVTGFDPPEQCPMLGALGGGLVEPLKSLPEAVSTTSRAMVVLDSFPRDPKSHERPVGFAIADTRSAHALATTIAGLVQGIQPPEKLVSGAEPQRVRAGRLNLYPIFAAAGESRLAVASGLGCYEFVAHARELSSTGDGPFFAFAVDELHPGGFTANASLLTLDLSLSMQGADGEAVPPNWDVFKGYAEAQLWLTDRALVHWSATSYE